MTNCAKCEVNSAIMGLEVHINGDQATIDLCPSCAREVHDFLNTEVGNNPQDYFTTVDEFYEVVLDKKRESSTSSSKRPTGSRVRTSEPSKSPRSGRSLIEKLGKNLTDAAREGHLDPVIGRDKEVKRVIQILQRKKKNNPVLLGEPGVGKTAVAEAFALAIIEKKVPAKLQDKEVYTLDVAALVSNTGIRGEFEKRMQNLIDELSERDDVIVFIDELHNLVGAGSAQGSMDAANILKPALARGDLQVIGATTLNEYRKFIEKDGALERRFQPVTVGEPSKEDALKIVKGIQETYEAYHGVSFTSEAVEACVTLSTRYIQDRQLPDKAIDLLDEAGARASLEVQNEELASLKLELEETLRLKDEATEEQEFEQAARHRARELELVKEIKQAETSVPEAERPVIELSDIQTIIEEMTGIPVGKLESEEQAKLKDFEVRLATKVIGQEDAVKKVSKAVKRARAGLKSKTRPIGSFLFVGPTGVGKTELTKALAQELFGEKDAFIRLDMSEYMEKHSVSKITGAPPGYVGFDDATGQLTEKVRRKPYSVILVDEVEKAHPDVANLFLQILDEGHLTDSQGRKVSFKDTVIIMTSNAGTQTKKKAPLGFSEPSTGEKEAELLENLGAFFKPEFLNRFDNVIEFKHLEKKELVKIVDLMLNEFVVTLGEQGIGFSITDNAKEKLSELGYSPAYGARPLRRAIQEHVEDAVADLLLEEDEVKEIKVQLDRSGIKVKKA